MDLQADRDVHGACYIHCTADISPGVFWDCSLDVQTAITPQEHPSIRFNLFKKRKKILLQIEHGEDPFD